MAINESIDPNKPDTTTTAIVPVEGTRTTWVPQPDIAGVLQEDGTFDEAHPEIGYNADGYVTEIRPSGDPMSDKINNFFTQPRQ